MALETATYIDALVTSNPDGADARSTADDHLRLIKAVLKRSFPLVGGAVSASAQALCYVNDLSAGVQSQINALRDGSATARNALVATTAMTAANASQLSGLNATQFARLDAYNEFTYEAQLRKSTTTYEYLQATSAPADEQGWIVNYASSAGWLGWATTGDSNTYGQIIVVVDRNGQTPTTIDWYGTVFRFNGVDLTNPTQLNSIPAASYARLDNAQTFGKGVGSTVVAVASGAVITPNMADGNVHRVVLSTSTYINIPSAPRSGQTLVLMIRQSTGGHAATWAPIYKFPAGADPALSTAAGACDVFAFVYDDVYAAWVSAGLNVS